MDLQLLRNIINTLNDIEVKGSVNMDKLLGCINALESIHRVEQIKQTEEVEQNG